MDMIFRRNFTCYYRFRMWIIVSRGEIAGLYTRVKEVLDLAIAENDSLRCSPTNNALLSARSKGAFS